MESADDKEVQPSSTPEYGNGHISEAMKASNMFANAAAATG